MPTVTVPHGLGVQEAKNRLSGLVPGLRAEFAGLVSEMSEEWKGDVLHFTFKARGFSVSGSAEVRLAEVAVDYTLPLLARPLKGQFESGIRERLNRLLS